MLDIAQNRPSKFKTENWVEINDDSRGTYETNRQIKFKTTMLRLSLCDYSNRYILLKGNTPAANVTTATEDTNNIGKRERLQNSTQFADYISQINNTQVDNAKHINVVIPIHNAIEYDNHHLKTSGSLWQYYRDELAVHTANDDILDFTVVNIVINSFKQKTITETGNDGTENIEIMISLKYLSNFGELFKCI